MMLISESRLACKKYLNDIFYINICTIEKYCKKSMQEVHYSYNL